MILFNGEWDHRDALELQQVARPLRQKNCVQASRDASISRIISTVDFHSIHLQIDAKANGVEIWQNEWCIIQYRTAAINWTNVNITQGNDYILNYEVIIPDNDVFNDQESFEVKLGIAAGAGGDSCYFDNFKVFGIALFTQTPTTETNDPTNYPSLEPTSATSRPSDTNNPTNNPTHSPSFNPTLLPSFNPFQRTPSPLFQPTFSPLSTPSNTKKKSNYDTNNKTNGAPASNTQIVLVLIIVLLSLSIICVILKIIKRIKGERESNNVNKPNQQVVVVAFGEDDIPNVARINSVSDDEDDEIQIEGGKLKVNPAKNDSGSKCTHCGAVVQQGTMDDMFVCVTCKKLDREDVDKEVEKMFDEANKEVTSGNIIKSTIGYDDMPNVVRVTSVDDDDDDDELQIEGGKVNPAKNDSDIIDAQTPQNVFIDSKCIHCGAVVQQETVDVDDMFVCVTCNELNQEDVNKEVEKMFDDANKEVTVGNSEENGNETNYV